MNYLAHLELSRNVPDVLVGNLMGDFLKGSLQHTRFTSLPVDVQKGIHLHRKIDDFTDNHVLVSEISSFFVRRHGKYSGIVVDVLFDHLLAKKWESLHLHESLADFAEKVYVILPPYQFLFPERMNKMVQSLLTHKWLPQYKTEEGVQMALAGISRRTSTGHSFHAVFDDFYAHEAEITELFMLYYPELQGFCTDYLSKEFTPI